MSTLTPNLSLFKIIPKEDAKKVFDFYEILNNNWDKIDTLPLDFNRCLSEMRTNLEQVLNEQEEFVRNSIENIQIIIAKLSYAPDYSKGIEFNGSYTALKNGWIFAWGDGSDTQRWIYCNNKPVITWCGPSMGYYMRTGATFMVSKGDKITGQISKGYFYPFKVANVL